MEIIIRGNSKEIAALVSEAQKRQNTTDEEVLYKVDPEVICATIRGMQKEVQDT